MPAGRTAPPRRQAQAVASLTAVCLALGLGIPASTAAASGATDQTGAAAVPPSASAAAPTLPAGDVAIGQPITLPAGDPAPIRPAVAAPAALPGAGTGWLGLTVDDAIVTGRLSVVDVAPDGPAAKAGIRPQDVLLALDGRPLSHDEEMAATLAAIAPGQQVKAAIGRDNRVENVELTAAARPADARARAWQPPGGGPTDNPPLANPAATAAASTAPFGSPLQPGSPQPATAQPGSPPAFVPQTLASQPAPFAGPPQSLSPTPGIAQPPAPPLAAVPPRSVLVQPPESAATVPSVADVAPSPFAQAPPVMTPAPRFGGPADTVPAAPPSAPVAMAEPYSPAIRRFAEPAGLLPPPAVAIGPTTTLPQSSAASGRPALGVRTVPVDTAVQSRFRLPDPRGALVIGVVHDLPASRAGVPPGSVIVAINDRPVGSPQDLSQLVSHGPVGIPVSLQYVLPGGEAKRAEVVLQPLEAPLERALVGGPAAGEAIPATEPPQLQPAPALARRIPAGGTDRIGAPIPGSMVIPASAATANATAGGMQSLDQRTPSGNPSRATSGGVPADPRLIERLEELVQRLERRVEELERRLDATGRLNR